MTYENVKTVILTVLVLVSLLLYYVLWTHQGNYQTSKGGSTIELEKIGSEKEVSDVVKPDKIYQHLNGDHYGTIASSEINHVVNTIKKWDFHHVKKMEINQVASFIQQQNHSMEIRFPAEVPFTLYKSILNVKEENQFDFDTMLISYDLSKNQEGIVYFISRTNGKVYQSIVSASYIDDLKKFTNHVTAENTVYKVHFIYEVSGDNLFYLPINESEMKKYKYLYETIESAKLKRALFNDPSLVQKSLLANKEEFTDDTGLLRIDKDTHIVSFLKPSGVTTNKTFNNQLIQNSIEYVNQHGGWINEYRYVSKNESLHQTMFRLYTSVGYPIFNLDNNISEIQVVWENNDVKKFYTSNLDLSTFWTDLDSSSTTLMPGKAVEDHLEKIKGFNKAMLQDVTIGYDMVVDSQNIINLKPSWYYKYNNQWYQVESSDLGGKEIGLE
ncbi:YycH family regulatory protein [Niallia sp. 03190]|uniref:YycH family regulatory protein n=1 Tax=Niallia sp. 03190 TaxID=3458061 RepID=UPI004043A7C9